jgi:quinohemoprotein ethanol dehydrogenase
MAGGVLTTAPGLVFAGRADGVLQIFDVADGKTLKEIATGTSIMAAPSTYAVDGVQYVAVQAGYGGGGGFSFPPYSAAYKYGNQNRIIVFKLGGGRTPIPEPVQREPIPEPPALPATAAQIQAGDRLFLKYCSSCHAFGPGLVPDLRRMAPETHEAFEDIVLRGLYVSKGMGRFDDVLSSQDAQNIRRYIVAQAKGAVGRTDEVGDNLKKQ